MEVTKTTEKGVQHSAFVFTHKKVSTHWENVTLRHVYDIWPKRFLEHFNTMRKFGILYDSNFKTNFFTPFN